MSDANPTAATLDGPGGPTEDLQARMERFLRLQSSSCAGIGSPIYEELCVHIADDVRRGGVSWDLLASRAHLSFGAALPLRFLGAVHRLALSGGAPRLAAHYPSCGGTSGAGLLDAFDATVRENSQAILPQLDADVQTNEVGRSAVLFEALGHIAELTGHPLALREIGASAGLNLAMPWFRYSDGDHVGGDPSGVVEIADRWRGDMRPRFRSFAIASRSGCDRAPVDATTEAGLLRLLGFIWPDQLERLERTRRAVATLRAHPVSVHAANAADWLDSQLTDTAVGDPPVTTVVYHSIVWQYVAHDDRARITAALERRGALATRERPLAWVRFEPEDRLLLHARTTLRLWDGVANTGAPQALARSGFHGEWVELCEPEPA